MGEPHTFVSLGLDQFDLGSPTVALYRIALRSLLFLPVFRVGIMDVARHTILRGRPKSGEDIPWEC